jgi:integrase
MRIGELEALTWGEGDVDEPRGRWRVSAEVSKTSRPRWVTPPAEVFAAVVELVPREDRDLATLVFEGFAASRLRTSIGRACRPAGVPLFSPHGLSHRRISLLHLSGAPWARIGEAMRQLSLVTANTKTHVLTDERELDFGELLAE